MSGTCRVCEMETSAKPMLQTYMNVLEVIGTCLPDIPYSPHRSRRLWKKLRRSHARPLYGRPKVLVLRSDLVDNIRKTVS